MKCEHVDELLYDYVISELEDSTYHDVKSHLETCDKCAADLEELKKTLELIDQWQPREISPDFKERAMTRFREYKTPKRELHINGLLDKLVHIFDTVIPSRQWAAAALSIMLIISVPFIYKHIVTDNGHKRHIDPQNNSFTVKNPIVLETDNTNKTLTSLQELIEAHKGELIDQIWADGVRIIFSLDEQEKESFFYELEKLGKIYNKEKHGYTDKHGNSVIIVKESY